MFVRNILSDNDTPSSHFLLIQDIRHLAAILRQHKKELFIYWIPSHLQDHTRGRFSIPENERADELANTARNHENNSDQILDHSRVRDSIMHCAAHLTWQISGLLRKFAPDDPSSDDFSSADADQVVLPEDNL